MATGEPAPATNPRKPGFLTKRLVSDLATALALALLVSVIWITNSDLWTRANWDLPADYGGDSHQILGWIKAASEGDYHLLDIIHVSRLGAPFGANWNDYPMYEKAYTILLGWLARSIGLMAAANVGMMLTHALAAASFYLACRWFRWPRLWSMVGALLFGFLYYNTMRALGHLLLGLTYTVPWAILSSWLIASRARLPRFSRAWKFCLGVSFLMGISNPYYLNIYVQFTLLSLLFIWFTNRRRENLEAGIFCLLTSAAGFILAHTGALLFRLFAGANPYAIARRYNESELYALRPIELIIPPMGHRLEWLSNIGLRYQNETLNRGEIFSPYLGILGLVGLGLLIGFSLHRLVRNQSQSIPLPFWQTLWVLAYSVVGGVNGWLAYCGIGVFRASNRNSLFIAGLVLLWLVPRMRTWTKNWSPPKTIALALFLVCFGIADQLPHASRETKRAKIQADVTDDRIFSEQLEAKVPAGSMVFQLPLSVFPEGNPVMDMDSYEHLRPYFFTRSLRFTYGSNKGRSDSSWQAEIERLPASEMTKRLERLGFSVLLINRKGFVDDAQGLLSFLGKLGYQDRLENQAKDMVAVFLKPVPDPELPRTDLYPVNNYGHFWRRFDSNENEVLWLSQAYAEIQINRDVIKGKKVRLRARISVPNDRTVSFMISHRVIVKKLLEKDIIHQVEFEFDVPPTGELLRIDTDRPQAGFQNSAVLTATFALLSFELTPLP